MKRTTDLITVVIPVYNRAEMLRACLDSIQRQTVLPAEVIVVDDGSTDNSAEIARQHPLGVRVLSAPHSGVCSARNTGLEAVNTPWTLFFDSDDTMTPDHIANILSADLDSADLAGWDVTRLLPDGSTQCLPFETKDIRWHNLMHGTLATQRYMARTELFRSAGAWNPELLIWVDIELGSRLLGLNPRVIKVDSVTPSVIVNVTTDSVTGNSWSSRIDRYTASLSVLEKNIGAEHQDWLSLKRAILAADIAREDSAKGKSLYRSIEPRNFAVRLAYHYRRLGGRGAARLLRRFFTTCPADNKTATK